VPETRRLYYVAMSSDIDFDAPVPLFPLLDTVLLPHAVQPLHIFEPRYRQMVSHTLPHGHIAMATLDRPAVNAPAMAPMRPIGCVSSIVEHAELPDGCYLIQIQGLERVRITSVLEPADGRAYNCAFVEPIGATAGFEDPMPEVRTTFRQLLDRPRMARLTGIERMRELVARTDIPTVVALEVLGFALVHDTEVKYRLLEEGEPLRRAEILMRELHTLDRIIARSDGQAWAEWPKGMSWN
jgi:Lon protease-like protein